MAKEEKVQPEQNEALRGILDPIAPEDLTEHGQNVSGWLDPMRDLNPEYLANMDYNKEIHWGNQSFNQYWDDSSPEKQWTLGWMNEKYTWANTKNSDINYNPDITTKDLNPNFVYGQTSKVYGTDHPWYISQRNDDIASALYNEWRVSKEEVQKFLEGQTWFFNSSEADRANTVESVWKRLWAIAEQNKQEEEPDLSKAEEIEKDYSWKIYWKTTAEEWEPKEWINTLADKNSVYSIMEAWRIARLKALVVMKPEDIATSMVNGINPEWEQAWRDLQQYYPEVAAQVNAQIKKMNAQSTVTAIASWDELPTNTNGIDTANNDIVEFANSNANWVKSSQEITKDVHNSLAQNQTANEASETMAVIEEDMAILKNRLKNLKQEANSVFKWDVPQYLVNAYINNKTQEIQNQMSILEDRYNAAYSRYKTELANAQWEKEYQLKQEELELKRDSLNLEKWKAEQWLSTTTSSTSTNTSTTNEWDSHPVTTLSDEEVSDIVDWLLEDYDYWRIWKAQCAAWIQKYYFPRIWISIGWLSSYDAKKSLINEDSDYIPKKWDLVIFSSKSSPANWHIWIVLSVSSDWTLQYLDWNGSLWKDWKWTETVAINSTSLGNKSIQWFRNINKLQDQTSDNPVWQEWTDYDYTRFEQYRDTTSKWEKETIAAEYWTDVKWMNDIVREALSNRGNNNWWSTSTENVTFTDDEWKTITYADWVAKDDPRLNMPWFDPVLWFNPVYSKIYKWIADWTIKDVEKTAEDMWITKDQLISEVRNYWLNSIQWWARNEESSYSSALLDVIAKLYNEASNDSWKLNFRFFKDIKKNTYRNLIYKQLKSMMTLEKMVEARNQNIWFGQVTEWEWAMLSQASSALWNSVWASDRAINSEMEIILKALWHDVYWQNDDWTEAKWEKYRQQYWNLTTTSNKSKEQLKTNLWWSSETKQWSWANREDTMRELWLR